MTNARAAQLPDEMTIRLRHLTQRLGRGRSFHKGIFWRTDCTCTDKEMETTSQSGIVTVGALKPGALIDVETKTRHYKIECLGGNAIRIQGHPRYCPEPTPAFLQGSVDHDGVDWGHIARGKHLVFFLQDSRPVRTSRIVTFHVDKSGNQKPADPALPISGRIH